MKWAIIISENFGSILGVLGTLGGVGLGAWIESVRRRGDRTNRNADALIARRTAAHEDMLAAFSRAQGVLSMRVGSALAEDLDDVTAAARLDTSYDAYPSIDEMMVARAKVQLHCGKTAVLADRAVRRVLKVGAAGERLATGRGTAQELRDAHAEMLATHEVYVVKARAEIEG